MWDSNLKARWDYENSIAFAREEAEERGMEKGMEKGEYKKALDIAREMKNEGVSVAQIMKFTKLPVEDIEKL
jgi:predicted transposase/invertase (TIGR01784 family)